jgi:hypothetical protein
VGFEMWTETHTASSGFFCHTLDVTLALGFIQQQCRNGDALKE